MSNYLGFEPCKGIDYFFVSYNNEDADRVGVIAEKLNSKGVPLWYDFGIPYGDLWEKTISKKIKDSKAVILFFTKDILLKEHSYVRDEYKIATEYFDKKVYVVMMDTINSKDVPGDKVFWWINIKDRQNIDVADVDNLDDVIWKIADALGISVAELVEEYVMREYIEAEAKKRGRVDVSSETVAPVFDFVESQVDKCNEEPGSGFKVLKYSDCKDLMKRINISSASIVIPEEFGAISEHALEGLWVEKIYIPKTILLINENSLLSLGYKTKAIYLHKDNPVYLIGENALTNKTTGKSVPVKNGIALRYYSK